MESDARLQVVNDFLGSSHVFSLAVKELMEKEARDSLGTEVTLSQLKLLKLVSMTKAEKISDVAGFLGVSHPAASKAVDRLVRRNLVDRREDKDDRRAARLSLTRTGQRLLNRFIEIENKTMRGLFSRFRSAQLKEAAVLLDNLSADLINTSESLEKVCFRCGVYFREKCVLREAVGSSCFFTRNRQKRKKAKAK